MDVSPSRIPPGPHNLLELGPTSAAFLGRILRVYPQEVRLLLWVTLIQLVMRISTILISNFSQTTFLKRFGVEYLPTVFVVEAVITLLLAGIVGWLMERYRTFRVFTGLFFCFAFSIALIRGLLPLGWVGFYPILYILKSLAEGILPILYWDILSDLFTTQQSKRLYTLITAGGVLGTTLGSLLTGPIARWVGMDNVLFIFVGGMLLAAILNEFTERVAGYPLEARPKRRQEKSKPDFRKNLAQVLDASRQSALLKYLIVLTAIPNVVLPILMYQFNVAVDGYFASEARTLHFFGVFRGISNAVMFVILLFSSRLITRWGVPNSLLWHPANYLLSLLGLFFRFDIFSATYARFSTETLKTTLNNPARAILYNFFPPQMRGLVRVFLRGTVVRVADITGSGFLMLVRGVMDPRLLSLVAAPLVLLWMWTTFRIRKRYPNLLIDALRKGQIQLGEAADEEFRAWLKDKSALEKLRQGLADPDTRTAIACAEMLAKAGPRDWNGWLLEGFSQRPLEVQRSFLGLLSLTDAPRTVPVLLRLAQTVPAEILPDLLAAISRLQPGAGATLMKEHLASRNPRLQTEALVGIYRSGEEEGRRLFRESIRALINQGEEGRRLAAEALSRTGDADFAADLLKWSRSGSPDLQAPALRGLAKLQHKETIDLARKAIQSDNVQVREGALEVLEQFQENVPPQTWTALLADPDAGIRRKAAEILKQSEQTDMKDLLALLASPSRTAREEVLRILQDLGSPSAELSRFVNDNLRDAYTNLARARLMKQSGSGQACALLAEHLQEKIQETVDVVLRVLVGAAFGDKLKVILTAIHSRNRKDMDNAIEALEASLHPEIRKSLIPLLAGDPGHEVLVTVCRSLGIEAVLAEPLNLLLSRLLDDADQVTRVLTLYSLIEVPGVPLEQLSIPTNLKAGDELIREAAVQALEALSGGAAGAAAPPVAYGLLETLSALRRVPIFSDFRVRELVSLAGIAVPREAAAAELVVKEGEPGDALYIILAGEVSVRKGAGTPQERKLGFLGPNDFFGELALIGGYPRTATVKVEKKASLLVIAGDAFIKLIADHPSLPLRICGVLCRRIRDLQARLGDQN